MTCGRLERQRCAAPRCDGAPRTRGFTLIELIVAMAVLAILVAIAVPAYTSNVTRSRRSDATVALTAISQQMERWFTERNTYAGATLGTTGIYPDASENGFYGLALSGLSATGYTITATRQGRQTGDACGDYTLTALGAKGVANGSLPADLCWTR